MMAEMLPFNTQQYLFFLPVQDVHMTEMVMR